MMKKGEIITVKPFHWKVHPLRNEAVGIHPTFKDGYKRKLNEKSNL